MKIKIIIKKNKNLLKSEKDLINKNRVREFGKKERKDFKKDYELDAKWFFVKDKGKIVALGGLRPIKINYLGRKYNIMGICSIISVEKGKGYGKILIHSMVGYLKRTGKTGLGFTSKTEFFEKVGLKSKKDFIKRFRYKNPKTGKVEIDNDGDGIYYEGKDKLLSKILKTKGLAYSEVDFW